MPQFTSDNQPKTRGRSFRTKLFDTIRNECLLDLPENSSKDTVENAFLKHLATKAFNEDDPQSTYLLRELLNKSYAGLKSTMPEIAFDLDEDSTPLQKANAILKAVSDGKIPPDVGALLVQSAKHTIDIEVGTELKERIEKIEESLGLDV